MNSRSAATARTNALSVCLATRRVYSEARSIEWATLSARNLYLICGARLSGIRSAESMGARSAGVPAPESCAIINNNEVPPEGMSLPWPRTSSRRDALAGARCFFARCKALRSFAVEARLNYTIHWQTTKMSLRTDMGSQRALYTSIKVVRRPAASSAIHTLLRKGAVAPGDHAPAEEVQLLLTQEARKAIGGGTATHTTWARVPFAFRGTFRGHAKRTDV